MSEKKDYFDYVGNVLGVKSILLNQQPSTLQQVVPLLICVDKYDAYSSDESELLAKMIGALKIDLQLIKVVDLKQRELFQPEFVISFIDDLDQSDTVQINAVTTYSPRFLLKNPDYKKNAWSDLQKVILHFKNSN